MPARVSAPTTRSAKPSTTPKTMSGSIAPSTAERTAFGGTSETSHCDGDCTASVASAGAPLGLPAPVVARSDATAAGSSATRDSTGGETIARDQAGQDEQRDEHGESASAEPRDVTPAGRRGDGDDETRHDERNDRHPNGVDEERADRLDDRDDDAGRRGVRGAAGVDDETEAEPQNERDEHARGRRGKES